MTTDEVTEAAYPIGIAAVLLGRSVFVLRDMEAKGRIKAQRSAGGHRLFPQSEIDRVLAQDKRKRKQAK